MKMFQKFAPDAVKAMVFATDEAYQLGSSYCGTEHVLIGLACVENAKPAQTLAKNGVKLDDIRKEVCKVAGLDATSRRESNLLLAFEGPRFYSPRCLRVICMFDDLESIQPEQLLLGIIKEADEIDKDGYADRVLTNLGLNKDDLKRELTV